MAKNCDWTRAGGGEIETVCVCVCMCAQGVKQTEIGSKWKETSEEEKATMLSEKKLASDENEKFNKIFRTPKRVILLNIFEF